MRVLAVCAVGSGSKTMMCPKGKQGGDQRPEQITRYIGSLLWGALKLNEMIYRDGKRNTDVMIMLKRLYCCPHALAILNPTGTH